MTSQSYIITFHSDNLINNGWQAYHDLLWDTGKFLYIGSQLERAPQTGRLHWQAFVKFSRDCKQKKTWFHRFIPGAHLETVSQERAAAINYGCKEDTRVEGPKESEIKPAPKESGKKWEEIKEKILEDKKEEVPFHAVLQFRLEQRWEGLRAFYQEDSRSNLPPWLPNPWGKLISSTIQAKKRHYWIFSRLPNKGKTYHFAKPLVKNYKATLQVGHFDYWNVSKTDQAVVLDEFNFASLKWNTLNSMCDGSHLYRKIYSSGVVLSDPLIIVLSNKSIVDLYPNAHIYLIERFNEIEIL